MELNQLRTFLCVAKYMNMSRAAEEMGIAQPAISQSIRRLEDELKCPLFHRKGKKISLSPEGQYLMDRLPDILSPLDQLRDELKVVSKGTQTTLRIAVLSGSMLIPSLVAAYRRLHPVVEFVLHGNERECDLIVTSWAVERGEGDLSSNYGQQPSQHRVQLLEEAIAVAVPLDHRLSKQSEITLAMLQDEGFISLTEGSVLRRLTDRYCQKAGFTPHILFESDAPGTVRGLIEAGLGLAFYPLLSWGEPKADKVKLIPLVGSDLRRGLGIVWSNEVENKWLPKDFIAFAQDYFLKALPRPEDCGKV